MEQEKRISFLKSLRALGSVLSPSSKEDEPTQREDETTLKGNELKELAKLKNISPEIKDINDLENRYKEEELNKPKPNPIAKKRAELKVQAKSISGKRIGPKKQAKPVIEEEKEIEEK